MTASISVIIPNYNGKELLAAYLSTVVRAADEYDGQSEIIVVDDASGDGSAGFVHDAFPQVRVIALSQNRGFAHACNRGVKESSGEVAVLLNSDMGLSPRFFDPLVRHFEDDAVFAVSAQQKIIATHGTVYNSPVVGQFRHGLIKQLCEPLYERPPGQTSALSFYACGGGSAFRTKAFLDLGGFDELFHPFYWEDVDLSLRAWRRGWKVIFEPNSLLTHHISSTVSTHFSPSQVKVWNQKNLWLLVWRNTLDRGLLALHLLYLIPNLALELGRGNPALALGLLQALRHLPEVVAARQKEKRERRLSDKDMYRCFGGQKPGR